MSFRSGGKKGRDRADTFYGAQRPRESMAEGERGYIGYQKLLRERQESSTKKFGSSGSTSGGREQNSSVPAVATGLIIPDPFIVPNADFEIFSVNAALYGSGVVDYWCWRGDLSDTNKEWSGTFRYMHDGLILHLSKDIERFNTRDSNNDPNLVITGQLTSDGFIDFIFTASDDSSLGDVDVRLLIRAVESRP